MKFSHKILIVFSGLVWLAIGCYLLPLGLYLITESAKAETNQPLMSFFSPFMGGVDQVGIFLMALGLGIGYFKGKYVLSKSVQRSVGRIQSLPNPSSIFKVYGKSYLILLAVMVLLGVSIKLFGVPNDIRGAIDVAIGAALINGAVLFFRRSQTVA